MVRGMILISLLSLCACTVNIGSGSTDSKEGIVIEKLGEE